MAQYITLPASNLHLVPDQLTDGEACFAEPLAAACRILEQGLIQHSAIHLTSKTTITSSNRSSQQGVKGDHHRTTPATTAAGAGTASEAVAGEAGAEGEAAANGDPSSSRSTAQAIAVVGDGRLGLLVAQVLAVAAPGRVVLFGRHQDKMQLVTGLKAMRVHVDDREEKQAVGHQQQFDLVVEASGEGGQGSCITHSTLGTCVSLCHF